MPGVNVIGILPGIDTSRSVVIGAHYDHLGIRGDSIFYGADDNASGVAGVLSLAEKWTESVIKPPVNLVFACWTAEEKGLIGSDYFAKNKLKTDSILLYINMDMISRSAPEDTLQNILSIGTRKMI
ncbi:MAG: M20/M25/M40 family metallo-hydrolase [Saprospiraceae bacterium]|nr:M20/M25/M40 family metallo-hydrolase [Saprospiraceae bacterium]